MLSLLVCLLARIRTDRLSLLLPSNCVIHGIPHLSYACIWHKSIRHITQLEFIYSVDTSLAVHHLPRFVSELFTAFLGDFTESVDLQFFLVLLICNLCV